MPPLLRSNAYSYIVQGISTPRSRHPDKRQQASRRTAAGIPDTPPPQNQGGTLRVAALQSIMKPYFTPIYTYIYIYINIYINIKLFFDIYAIGKTTATLRGTARLMLEELEKQREFDSNLYTFN